MKRSSSRVSVPKGSVNHIGTTPYRFRVDMFISYVEHIKSLSEACITIERRGKIESTKASNVTDGKAVFREQLTMECTLFRKNVGGGKSKQQDIAQEDLLKFDEKKAKMYLRKGGPQGKAVAKLSLNLSDYIKSATSTVFADMKLSDGTIVVTKVDATMLAMDKKKKGLGSRTGSGFSEAVSVDDSLCGDEEDLESAIRSSELPSNNPMNLSTPRNSFSPVTSATNTPSNNASAPSFPSRKPLLSTVTQSPNVGSCASFNPHSSSSNTEQVVDSSSTSAEKTKSSRFSKRIRDSDIKESPSLKEKFKSKIRFPGKKDKSPRAEKTEKAAEIIENPGSSPVKPEPIFFDQLHADVGSNLTTPSDAATLSPSNFENKVEMKELKKCSEQLKKENHKLKKAKKEALEEIEALRSDLKACEDQLESIERKDKPKNSAAESKIAKLQTKIKDRDKKIESLKQTNESLMEEMEEQHSEMKTATKRLEENEKNRIQDDLRLQEKYRKQQARLEQGMVDQSRNDLQPISPVSNGPISNDHDGGDDNEDIDKLKKNIADLELALLREPTFMDVVNELKVMKMTVALSNMEKEQALFELKNMRSQFQRMESDI